METPTPDQIAAPVTILDVDKASHKFMTWVFSMMFFALAISSACVYVFDTYDYFMRLLFVNGDPTALTFFSLIAPFILSFIIRKRINRISLAGLYILFIIYAALIGICFSFILLDFVDSSTLAVFLASSLAYGVMAIIGLFSKQDLTETRPILTFMLAGLIIATPLVFLFPDLDMSLWFSYAGIIVFLGLSALHFSDLKENGENVDLNDPSAKKMAILLSLSLYADFVNLFIFLVGLFGKRR
jgi:FtsH-binding integral membrane protein